MLRYSRRIFCSSRIFKKYWLPYVLLHKISEPLWSSQLLKSTVQKSFKYKHRRINPDKETDLDTLIKYYRYKYSSDLHSLKQIMDVSLLLPPASVQGMTVLDREAFFKKITVPCVKVSSENAHVAIKHLKKFILKIDNLKPVQTDTEDSNQKIVLLNPLLVKCKDDVCEKLSQILKGEVNISEMEVSLGYENWKAEDILRAILPEDQENVHGYSMVGHIIHLNLRDHTLPYKAVIGEVLVEKTRNITLVVNKTNTIDSTFRNFQMEVIAGTGRTDVTVRENGCSFSFDFAKVYWNPRLSTEHMRIFEKIKQGDMLYDIMAGVGPFAIPAGKKKCEVLANDLNPHSFEALVLNCANNKVKEKVKCFNLDGHEFIKTILKDSLLKTWQNEHFCGAIHITMNLPVMAVEFLPSFKGIFSKDDNVPKNPTLPVVHVYMFNSDAKKDTAINVVAQKLGYLKNYDISATVSENSEACDASVENNASEQQFDPENFKQHIDEVMFVRSVSPNKHMMRVSFRLTLDFLISDVANTIEPPIKKLREC